MITVNPHNFNQNEIAALNQAAAMWNQVLNPAVTVTLHIENANLPIGLLGLSIPNGVFSPQGGTQNCWYVSALADHLSQNDHQPGVPDGAIFIDANTNWYIGNGGIQNNQYDFLTNALHEMGHSFGFVALFSENNGAGFYGRLTSAILPPQLQLPFAFPNLNGWPSILGLRTVSAQQGNRALVTPGVQCPTQGFPQLGQDLVNPALFLVHGGTRDVYAPGMFQLFSSFDHLDPNVYPNALMQPHLPQGVQRHNIDQDSLAVLRNLGW